MFQVQVVIQLMVNGIGTKTLQIVLVQYNSFIYVNKIEKFF